MSNHKYLYFLVIITAVLIFGLFYYIYNKYESKNSVVANTFSGTITKIEENLYTVSGNIMDENLGNDIKAQQREIIFKVTAETELTKITQYADLKQKGSYTPKRETTSGQIQDLKTGTRISKITSNDNLLGGKSVTADSIEFMVLSISK
jgi:hypothetical protein